MKKNFEQLEINSIQFIYYLFTMSNINISGKFEIERNSLKSNKLLYIYILVCDYEFVNKKFGWFTSPQFPKNYYENANCTYRIKTEQNNAIQIQFTDFYLENKVNGKNPLFDSF